jgi:hypothetical protein
MWVIAVCWIAWPRQTENVVAAFLSIAGSTAFFTGLGQAWLWLVDPTSQYAIAGPTWWHWLLLAGAGFDLCFAVLHLLDRRDRRETLTRRRARRRVLPTDTNKE